MSRAVWSDPQHRKHAFIVTTAGKPVWSLHGDSDALASLAPVVQAVLARAEDCGEPLTQMTLSDGSTFLVSSRGPLHCCIFSRTGECVHALSQQLRVLHSYFCFATLPSGSIPKALEARPGLDVRPQCQGVEAGMAGVVRLAAVAPSLWMDAYPMAPPALLGAVARSRLAGALAAGGKTVGASGQLLYSLLLSLGSEAGGSPSLLAWAQQSSMPLRPTDLHCLAAYAATLSSTGGGSGGGGGGGGGGSTSSPGGPGSGAGREGGRGADVWVPCGFPGLSSTGTVQVLLRALGSGRRGGGAGEGAPLPALRSLPSPLEQQPQEEEAPPAAAPPPSRPPALLLALVMVGEAEAAQRRASLVERALAEAGLAAAPLFAAAASAAANSPSTSTTRERGPQAFEGVMEPLHSALGLASPHPTPASSLALLHFGYLWKPARQWAGCGVWPAQLSGGGGGGEAAGGEGVGQRREAVAAAFGEAYTQVCAPPARHFVSAVRWRGAGGGAPARCATVAAINTSNAVVLALWGGGEEGEAGGLLTDRVPGLMEKLAKTLGKMHDKLLCLPVGKIQ